MQARGRQIDQLSLHCPHVTYTKTLTHTRTYTAPGRIHKHTQHKNNKQRKKIRKCCLFYTLNMSIYTCPGECNMPYYTNVPMLVYTHRTSYGYRRPQHLGNAKSRQLPTLC